MSKYSISDKKNLIKITQKSIRKVPINERELAVFQENLLPGLFRPVVEGKHRIAYTAPWSIPLKNYIKKGLNIHKFYSIVAQVVEMTKKIEMYKFNLPNLVLNTGIIFVKETTGELFFLYEPLMSRENSINVYGFLEEVTNEIQTEDLELRNECRMFQEFLQNTANYRIEDIEQYILNRYPQIYQEIKRTESGKSGFIASSQLANRQHYAPSARMEQSYTPERQPYVPQQQVAERMPVTEEEPGTSLLMEEDGTTLLDEEDGTTLLNEQSVAAGLIRIKTGEYFSIYGSPFMIGKSADNSLCLSDNKAISRKHAVIYQNNGAYTIMDQGSTNHTFLRGEMLTPNCEADLCDGDVIRLADEEFEFKIEE